MLTPKRQATLYNPQILLIIFARVGLARALHCCRILGTDFFNRRRYESD